MKELNRQFRPRRTLGIACLLAAMFAGCGEGTSGDPKDFGPVDTSQATVKSEDAKAFPAGSKDDGSGRGAARK